MSNKTTSDSDNASFFRNFCQEFLDEHKIRFYKVGICKTNPIAPTGNTNPSDMCFSIFDKLSDTTDAGGTEITLLLKSNILDIATSKDDATRIFYAMKFNTSLQITEKTNTFELAFAVTDRVATTYFTNGANGLVIGHANAAPFQIIFTSK